MLVDEEKIIIEVELITPQVAKTLLETNTQNRPLNISHVKWLAMQMKKRLWEADATPIKVSTKGVLLDGQHRLHAIIESDTSQEIFIAYNVPDSSFRVMDTGRIRTAGDILSIAGFQDTKTAASMARMLINYERSQISSTLKNQGRVAKYAVTNAEILEYCESHDLNPYLNKAAGWYKTLNVYTKSEYGFFYYVLSRIDENDSILFLNAVSVGAMLEVDSPMFVLRKKLYDYKTDRISLSPSERFALTIKAWNLYRAKKTVKMLTYNIEKEPMPIPQ